jgi:hypothetical protein
VLVLVLVLVLVALGRVLALLAAAPHPGRAP